MLLKLSVAVLVEFPFSASSLIPIACALPTSIAHGHVFLARMLHDLCSFSQRFRVPFLSRASIRTLSPFSAKLFTLAAKLLSPFLEPVVQYLDLFWLKARLLAHAGVDLKQLVLFRV